MICLGPQRHSSIPFADSVVCGFLLTLSILDHSSSQERPSQLFDDCTFDLGHDLTEDVHLWSQVDYLRFQRCQLQEGSVPFVEAVQLRLQRLALNRLIVRSGNAH